MSFVRFGVTRKTRGQRGVSIEEDDGPLFSNQLESELVPNLFNWLTDLFFEDSTCL